MSNLHNNPHLELPPPGQQQQQRPQQPLLQQHYIAQQQSQQSVPSMYPKLPSSQDDLPPPGYSPYPQQQQQAYPQQQQQAYPQQQYPQQQYQQQYPQQQCPQQPPYYQQVARPQAPNPPSFYGSMPAPTTIVPHNNNNNNSSNSSEQHVIQPIENLKTKSQLVSCPHCHQLVYTVLDYDAGACTAISIGGLFLAGCHNGLCLVPWLFPWFKDITHECPSCLQKIAKYGRLERDVRILAQPPTI